MGKYAKLIGFLRAVPGEVCQKILLGLSATALGFAQAWFVARAITVLLEGKGVSDALFLLLGALAALAGRMLLIRWQEGFGKQMGAKVKAVIRSRVLDKLMQLGPAYTNDRRSGDLQSLVTDGVESFEPFLVQYLPQIAIVAVTTVVSTFWMWRLDRAVGLLVLVMAVLSILIPHLFMPAVSRVMIEYWQDYADLNAQYIDYMQGMSTLKSLGASGRAGASLAERAWHFARESMANLNVSLADSDVIVACTTIGSAVSILLASAHMAQGRLSYGSLLLILFLIGECMKPISDMNTYWHSSYLGLSVAEELFAVLDEPLRVQDPGAGQSAEAGTEAGQDAEAKPAAGSGRAAAPGRPDIRIENVTFRYEEASPDVLHGVDLEIQPGSMTAIAGRSGSGKSTLVQLLLRFYDVTGGAIRINGRDIRQIPVEELRAMIAVVFQDSYLFYGTIRENLRMARPSATDEEIEEAARQANAHEFITALPEGYDTLVGERGATLSGGERQRISIARAILKNAPILILDEATSSVDMIHEARIRDALERCMKDRTSIVVAHRLSTIEHADRIYVLEDGRVAGCGTAAELMETCPAWQRLVEAQKEAEEGGGRHA